MLLYFDSSALTKRYVREIGSAYVTDLMDPAAGHAIYTVSIARIEVVSAIVRRQRRGEISPADAVLAVTMLDAERRSIYHDVEVTQPLVNDAVVLVARTGLRAYDAVHLAVAMQMQAGSLRLGYPAPLFVCADVELNAAAVAEGLTVDDPNLHP